MRQGRNNGLFFRKDTKISALEMGKNDENQLLGVNLGADYCAEHEWGIKDIRHMLQINNGKEVPVWDSEERFPLFLQSGLEKRLISNGSTEHLHWVEKIKLNDSDKRGKKEWSGFLLQNITYRDEPSVYGCYASDSQTLVTAWSEKDFAVLSRNKEEILKLKEIFDAFRQNDIIIWQGGGGVFENAGLCIAIASRMPKSILKNWKNADIEADKLAKEARKTGIADRLRKAGKKYFALSPQREKDGSLCFWLNPMDQNNNNFCWCNVQDLDDWIADKGKIPMTAEQKKARGR